MISEEPGTPTDNRVGDPAIDEERRASTIPVLLAIFVGGFVVLRPNIGLQRKVAARAIGRIVPM